ncbi:hypothetical protein ASF40_12650 [Microbacterium sp. Leaf288]|nr:hypothetical protein ASF40_12650 [Microbacterium sp. Leaf288]
MWNEREATAMNPDDDARTWTKRRGAAGPAEDDWAARGLLIEEVYQLVQISPGKTESQCSSCGTGKEDKWYRAEDISVVFHWQPKADVAAHVYGWWYCPDHLARTKLPWSHWQEAPEALWGPRLRSIKHPDCQQAIGLGASCGQPYAGVRDGHPMCAEHIERFDTAERLSIMERRLLGDS